MTELDWKNLEYLVNDKTTHDFTDHKKFLLVLAEGVIDIKKDIEEIKRRMFTQLDKFPYNSEGAPTLPDNEGYEI